MSATGYTIALGDCVPWMRSLPDKSWDHCITDPPYSAHVHACGMRGADGWKGEIAVERDLGFAALAPDLRRAVAREVARLTRRWVLVFSDTESAHLWREDLVACGLEYVRTLFWWKKNGAPQFTGDRPAVGMEAITLCHPPGRKVWNGGGKQGVYPLDEPGPYEVPIVIERGAPGQEKRVHPAQKPERLMLRLVEDFTDPGDLIGDPFAGSGTTGAVALPLGRRFAGCELDPQHHATASARLAGQPYKLVLPEGVGQPAQVELL
jgi:site-specific DNA-methyltransferase (adenine-specific)